MFILICLITVATIQARIIVNDCNGIVLHNIEHEKQILKNGLGQPYQLAIDYDTNTLFFSISHASVNDFFKSAYLNLKTNDYDTIPNIKGGFANAVDGKNHKVYLGGNDGIYTYDFDKKTAIYLTARGSSIWQMFFKDRLYYTVYPSETAYVYENGESNRVPELDDTKAMLVAVDNNENIFFCNSSGLFCHEKAKNKTLLIGYYTLNGFSADMNGNLFFSTPDGLYSIQENGKKIERLVSLANIYGIAIEGDNNIIYASEDSIVRLTPTGKTCLTEENNDKFTNW